MAPAKLHTFFACNVLHPNHDNGQFGTIIGLLKQSDDQQSGTRLSLRMSLEGWKKEWIEPIIKHRSSSSPSSFGGKAIMMYCMKTTTTHAHTSNMYWLFLCKGFPADLQHYYDYKSKTTASYSPPPSSSSSRGAWSNGSAVKLQGLLFHPPLSIWLVWAV